MQRAAGQGIDGETTRIAEEVEHLPALRKRAHPEAIFPLVQEKARLLAFAPVHEELVPVFEDGEFVAFEARSLVQITVYEIQPGLERSRSRAFVVHRLEPVSVDLPEGGGNGSLGAEHAHRMGLQHTHAVIVVNDEARQAVPFPVYQAVAGGCGRCRQPAGLPERIGAGEHAQPEIRLGGIFVKAEHPDSDGAYLVMAAAEHAAVGGAHAHEVSLGGMAHDLGDGPGEDPGMETQEGLLPAGFQDDFIHCLSDIVRGKALRA